MRYRTLGISISVACACVPGRDRRPHRCGVDQRLPLAFLVAVLLRTACPDLPRDWVLLRCRAACPRPDFRSTPVPYSAPTSRSRSRIISSRQEQEQGNRTPTFEFEPGCTARIHIMYVRDASRSPSEPGHTQRRHGETERDGGKAIGVAS